MYLLYTTTNIISAIYVSIASVTVHYACHLLTISLTLVFTLSKLWEFLFVI